MRGLGFYPSDYEAECLQHELQVRGKRKVPFEELVKLFINHSHSTANGAQKAAFESSLKALAAPNAGDDVNVTVTKATLRTILTAEAEKVDDKDAEAYLRELFGKADEVPLEKLTQQVSRITGGGCFA